MICFHNPDESYGWLSNWYLSTFTVDEREFSSMEQYMMFSKAKLFDDDKIAEEIMKISDVAEIKDLGRKVKGFSERIWMQHREKIVKRGLSAKFSQNPDLKEKLLATGKEVLAECAVKDTIWGIGLSMHDDRRFQRTKWRGQNLLGKCLMEVRSELKRGE